MAQLTKDRVYVPVKKPPMISRSEKAGKLGTVRMECETFAIEKGKRSTLEWWKCYLDSCASYHTFFAKGFETGVTEGGNTMSGRCNAGVTKTVTRG